MLTPDSPHLLLNFLPIEVKGIRFKAYSSSYESKESLTNLRKEHQNCIFHRQGTDVLCIPLNDEEKIGDEVELEVSRSSGLVCKLVLENLQKNLVSSNRKIIQLSPFSFIDTGKDLIKESSFSEKLQGLHIHPKYSVEVKSIKTNNNSTIFGIVIDISAYFDISSTVKELTDKGINLTNTYVVEKSISQIKEKDWIHKHAIGKIISLDNSIIRLTDFKEKNTVNASECFPEPRKENFNSIMRLMLNTDYQNAKNEIQEKLLDYIGGIGKQNLTRLIIDEIKSISNKQISRELSYSVHDEMMKVGNNSPMILNQVSKPTYVYDPSHTKTDTWHNRGLNSFGPFDLESFHKKNPRIVVITPKMYQGEVEKFLKSFRNGTNGKGYFQQGFVRKYHINDMIIDFITFDYDSYNIAKSYREACLSALENEPYDLAFVIIEERFGIWSGDNDPYLISKSIFMSQGVPVQEIEIETIRLGEWSWPYTLDNIALASYVKMGGTPWTISTYEPVYHELVIGMGNAIISDSRLGSATRYVGITNVFSSDGSYLLNNISRDIYQDNYKKEILESLKSCIAYVAKRNAWQSGDHVRFIFHQQFKEYKNEDIEIIKEFIASLGDYQVQFAFVHLTEGHAYQIYDMNQNGVVIKFDKNSAYKGKTKGQLTPERGYVVQTSPRTVLLTLTGPNQLLTPFQGIPKPLQISLHHDSTFTDINYIAKQIFHFTFLNWRGFNTTSIPVTISYSNLIASLLGRLKDVSNWNPDIIRTQFKYSKWFL